MAEAAVIPREEFLDRPKTLFLIDMETVVDESDWLDLRRGISIIEQAAPGFGR
jgi:hypothetical protein